MSIRVRRDENLIVHAGTTGHGPTMYCTPDDPTCGTIAFGFVPPRGAKRPWIYFLGEAPGEEEAKAQSPFVGKSGEILTETLRQIDDSFEWYRIGNSVACRPTDAKQANRPPTNKELRTCSWFAQGDILQSRPAAIITLGKVPMACLFPGLTESLEVMQQMELNWMGIRVFPHYHPAYIARKGGLHSEAWQSWGLSIQKVFDTIKEAPPWEPVKA